MTRCPPAFPAGHYWYGGHYNGPGRPPKWIDRFVNVENENGSGQDSTSDYDHNEVDGFMEEDMMINKMATPNIPLRILIRTT